MVLLTVDILITIRGEKVVLISRKKEPFTDKLVLPGGHFEETDPSLRHACAREAEEEIGFVVGADELELFAELDAPGRDPRPGRRVSVVFSIDLKDETRLETCKAASDALEINVRRISSLSQDEIGFDHFKAIKKLKTQ